MCVDGRECQSLILKQRDQSLSEHQSAPGRVLLGGGEDRPLKGVFVAWLCGGELPVTRRQMVNQSTQPQQHPDTRSR